MDNWLVYTLGYLFAMFALSWPIGLVTKQLYHRLYAERGQKKDMRRDPWLTAYQGVVERGLYVTFLLLNRPEAIGFWLAVKVAGQWTRWGKYEDVNGEILQDGDRLNEALRMGEVIEGRRYYEIFLIGSALSIVGAVASARVMQQALDNPGLWIRGPISELVLLGLIILGGVGFWHQVSTHIPSANRKRAIHKV